jgi:N-acetylmuramoyl-L-alanine amidase
MRTISKIIVHCADTYEGMDVTAEDVRKWHTLPPPKGRGWSDIGYHFFIQRNGKIERGRPLERAGAHAKGFNSKSIGICYAGGKAENGGPEDNRTDAQKRALRALIAALLHDFPAAEVLGHCDLPNVKKACPCFDVKTWYYGKS